MIELKIAPFTLRYDGMFKIDFEFEGAEREITAFITLKQIHEIFMREGVETNQLEDLHAYNGLTIQKSVLKINAFFDDDKFEGFETSIDGEDYQMSYNMNLIECEFEGR